MVLFKRKPVQFLQPPLVEDESTEVWLIPRTGEIFVHYEEYLNRMDFLKQRRFICQITGHSGLSFFDALESELAGAKEVDEAFPEALKGPILRRVQFSTVSRVDNLVDQIYDEFKADYYPGEAVTVDVVNDGRLHGVVRDKTRFGAKVNADGTMVPPSSRYFVSLDDRPDEEAVVDEAHIARDRKIFTKSVLRSFIKKTVTREAWTGAPWLVKDAIAERYHIDTRVPAHLRYDTKLQERRQAQAQKRASHPHEMNGMANAFHASGPVRLPELKPAPKSQKSKQQQQQQQQHQHHHQPHAAKSKPNGLEGVSYAQMPPSGNPFQFPVSFRSQGPPPVFAQPSPPPPPPPPKYPIEDLQLEPQGRVRPPLRFLCSDPPVQVKDRSPLGDKVLMRSVGPLLETWDTLNVYCEIFKLDSFTFDDYVEAMQITSEEVACQLFEEIHCAVLKVLVRSEADGGKVEVRLPEVDEDDDDDDDDDGDDDDDDEQEQEPTPEPEERPPARATRSSMAKVEAERLAAEAAAAERETQEAEAGPNHRAEEALAEFDWIEQLRKRNFKDGGWELMVVGLLHQLSKNERQRATCEDLLAQLVPRDVEATQETVRQHYAALDVNYRAHILQIMCMLTAETKAVRGYMEDCSEQMTAYRKEKIEWQRQRKQALEDLKVLNDQRKILLPDNLAPSPSPPQDAIEVNGDARMSDAEGTPVLDASDEVADSGDDAVVPARRNLRRAEDRAAERRRKKEEEQERRERADAAAKLPKQSKQFVRLLKDIQKKEDLVKECEEEIATIDNDLREADCPRTRVLGKDRFWNRYYWFERNGMPYGGLPDSSTAAAAYANGCIWVQGPDELEREGYIDMVPEHQGEYKAKFDMTVPERKRREEGVTSVFTATQWGYIDDPAAVDVLIEWLDPRGFNELRLRKEMINFRGKIVKNMENRRAYLRRDEKDEKRDDEGVTTKRMSTRTRTVQTPEPPSYRCLAWQNTTAVEELGHLHSEPPPPASRSRKQSRKKGAADAAAAEAAAEAEAEAPRKKRKSAGRR